MQDEEKKTYRLESVKHQDDHLGAGGIAAGLQMAMHGYSEEDQYDNDSYYDQESGRREDNNTDGVSGGAKVDTSQRRVIDKATM